jgi:hypothetical protein
LVAIGAVKGLFRHSTGNVPTPDVLALLGVAQRPGAIPDWIAAWRDAEPFSPEPAVVESPSLANS